MQIFGDRIVLLVAFSTVLQDVVCIFNADTFLLEFAVRISLPVDLSLA